MNEVKRWEFEDAAHHAVVETRPSKERAGLSPRTCHVCGSIDGMQAWIAETVAELDEATLDGFYRHDADLSHVFDACPVCNRAGTVPVGYEPITAAQATAWARAEVTAYGP